ncbi:MAG: hypothetical protein J7M05_06410 [Anaerolineae bacterium]|nr:hypothetical protein [Anaerolineae bacterium]
MQREMGPEVWMALAAGGLYLGLEVLVRGLRPFLRWRFVDRAHPRLLRLRFWGGWPLLGQVAGVFFTVLYLYAALVEGFFSPLDVGLCLPRGSPTELWKAFGIVLGLGLWIVVLLLGAKKAELWRAHSPLWSRQSSQVLRLLGQESALAILRAGCAPLLGSYWGAWCALFLRGGLGWLSSREHIRVPHSSRRLLIALTWALDWVSTLLFVLLGSLWAALLGRALVFALTWPLLGRKNAQESSTEVLPSAEHQR